jgi:transcriptional regulator with XRE-family HTH domain
MPAQSTTASDSHLETIADNIRDARKRQALTQADLAQRAGISVSFISMIERAERAPSYETLFAVAKGLAIPVAQMFTTADTEPVDYGPYRSLVDWARNAHLSRSQVERLIAAGRAMFGVETPVEKTVAKAAPRAENLCTAAGCRKPLLAKGLCVAHYREKLRKQQR